MAQMQKFHTLTEVICLQKNRKTALASGNTLLNELEISYLLIFPNTRVRYSNNLINPYTKDGEQKSNTKGHADHLIKPSFGEGYYNWLLFPNFHMASPDGGRSYLIEVHNPIAPDRTEITHYVICSKPNQPNDMFLDEFIEHRLRGLHTVLEEDYEVCENVQKAIEFTSLEQNIGAYEYYNVNIASLYRILMKR